MSDEFDNKIRLLILKHTYKPKYTIETLSDDIRFLYDLDLYDYDFDDLYDAVSEITGYCPFFPPEKYYGEFFYYSNGLLIFLGETLPLVRRLFPKIEESYKALPDITVREFVEAFKND